MATIKELKEQRNNALDKMDEIKKNVNANGTGSESRSLTEQETSEFRSLVNEVSAIDTQIEEIRNLKGNKVEERDMAEQNLAQQFNLLLKTTRLAWKNVHSMLTRHRTVQY